MIIIHATYFYGMLYAYYIHDDLHINNKRRTDSAENILTSLRFKYIYVTEFKWPLQLSKVTIIWIKIGKLHFQKRCFCMIAVLSFVFIMPPPNGIGDIVSPSSVGTYIFVS